MKSFVTGLLVISLLSACTKEVAGVQPLTSVEKTSQTLKNVVTNSSKLTIYIVRFSDRYTLDTVELSGGNANSLFVADSDFIIVNGNFYSLNNLVEYRPVVSTVGTTGGTYTALYLYFG